jgi:DNA-binding NarL/FixJ family response regulator
LSQHDELSTIRQAFGVGARGYVVKSDAGKELIPAIHAVRAKHQYLNKRFAERL